MGGMLQNSIGIAACVQSSGLSRISLLHRHRLKKTQQHQWKGARHTACHTRYWVVACDQRFHRQCTAVDQHENCVRLRCNNCSRQRHLCRRKFERFPVVAFTFVDLSQPKEQHCRVSTLCNRDGSCNISTIAVLEVEVLLSRSVFHSAVQHLDVDAVVVSQHFYGRVGMRANKSQLGCSLQRKSAHACTTSADMLVSQQHDRLRGCLQCKRPMFRRIDD